MAKSRLIRLNQHGGKSLPKGPARDICEAIAALFKPHGLDIQIANSYGPEHWSVLAYLPQDHNVWAGVMIDGTDVL